MKTPDEPRNYRLSNVLSLGGDFILLGMAIERAVDEYRNAPDIEEQRIALESLENAALEITGKSIDIRFHLKFL